MYLAGACDTQRCQQSVPSMVTRCAQHTLNHRHNARRIEELLLLRIFFEHTRKRKALYSSLPVVARWRFDRDMCGMASFAVFDIEESRVR